MNAPLSPHQKSHPAVGQLRERVENQARHIETLERCLNTALGRAGLESQTITLQDQLPRLPLPAEPAQSQPRDGRRGLPRAVADPGTDPSWWPTAAPQPQPLPPEPGWSCYGLADRVTKVLGISLLGMDDARLAAMVAMISGQQRKTRDFLPVFLTTSTAFHVFREQGFVFEYFPAQRQRDLITPDGAWQDYLAERLALVAKKWGMTRVICFGQQAIGTW